MPYMVIIPAQLIPETYTVVLLHGSSLLDVRMYSVVLTESRIVGLVFVFYF